MSEKPMSTTGNKFVGEMKVTKEELVKYAATMAAKVVNHAKPELDRKNPNYPEQRPLQFAHKWKHNAIMPGWEHLTRTQQKKMRAELKAHRKNQFKQK